MAETLTSPTPAGLAFEIDPNVRVDGFWDDDKYINFGKLNGESNQAYGRIGRDSANGVFKVESTKDGSGTTEPIAFFMEGAEAARFDTSKRFLHGSTSANAFHYIVQPAATSGTPVFGIRFDGGAHTGLANAEANDVNFNTGRTVTFGTTAGLSLQRAVLFGIPTYSCSSATKTITEAASVALTSGPVAGTNVAIGTSYGLRIGSASVVSGGGTVTTAYGLFSTAPTGATANWAAGFSGDVLVTGDLAGGTGAGDNLTLLATTNATPGPIIAEVEPGVEAWRTTATGEFLIGTASGASEIIYALRTQNASTIMRLDNLTTGTAALSQIQCRANTGGAVTASLLAVSTSFSDATFRGFCLLSSSGASSSGIMLDVGTADPIVFRTNSTEEMRLLSGGGLIVNGTAKVGAEEFRVVGQARIDTSTAPLVIAQGIATSGSPTLALVTGAAHTNLTASTEATSVNYNLAQTVEFATGNFALQRAYLIQAPTYAFVGVSTVDKAITFAVSGAPAAGPNATLTQSYSAEFTDAVRITGTTATAFLELDNGVTAAVSIAGEARMRYNDTTKEFQQSVNGGAYTALMCFPEFQLFADQLENPNSADWTVNALAPAEADDNNAGLTVRAFDDTAEEGVGFTIDIPSGATNMIVSLRGRARTAPGAARTVGIKLYNRGVPNNAAVQAWSAAKQFSDLDITTNEFFQYDTEATFSLASVTVTAGESTQFELTRDPTPVGGTNLVGDYLLHYIKVTFS